MVKNYGTVGNDSYYNSENKKINRGSQKKNSTSGTRK